MDDLVRHSMESEHLILENLGHAFGCEQCMCWNGMHLLGDSVHYYANGVKTIGWGQQSNEVGRDCVPGSSRITCGCSGALKSTCHGLVH